MSGDSLKRLNYRQVVGLGMGLNALMATVWWVSVKLGTGQILVSFRGVGGINS